MNLTCSVAVNKYIKKVKIWIYKSQTVGHKSLPLQSSYPINVSQRWFPSCFCHTDVCSHVLVVTSVLYFALPHGSLSHRLRLQMTSSALERRSCYRVNIYSRRHRLITTCVVVSSNCTYRNTSCFWGACCAPVWSTAVRTKWFQPVVLLAAGYFSALLRQEHPSRPAAAFHFKGVGLILVWWCAGTRLHFPTCCSPAAKVNWWQIAFSTVTAATTAGTESVEIKPPFNLYRCANATASHGARC